MNTHIELAGEPVDLELFAGPGGTTISAGKIRRGHPHLGIEIDQHACATRAAAGYLTLNGDVARIDPSRWAGHVDGFMGSPVCVQFSAGGDRLGTLSAVRLTRLIRDLFHGCDTRDDTINAMFADLQAQAPADWTDTRRHAAASSAALVAEPARYIQACWPEWIFLEQVPWVLRLWETYAAELRRQGYSAWCGIVNAVDYGLPQSRRRAVLIASRSQRVWHPPATHYDPRGDQPLFTPPAPTMAEAIGWGSTCRPSPTVTAGGTRSGGPEFYGHGARIGLEKERDAGRWIPCPRDPDCIRPDLAEAALLQGFPAGHPFQGTRTRQATQIGNAVPPPLAAACIAMASGVPNTETEAA